MINATDFGRGAWDSMVLGKNPIGYLMLPIIPWIGVQLWLIEPWNSGRIVMHLAGNYSGHLPDVFLDFQCFVLESSSDADSSSVFLFSLGVQPQGAVLWMKTTIHDQKLPCLDICGLLLLL